jgi:hypothetical protein
VRILERGILNAAEAKSRRAVCTFPSLAVLDGGELLATYRTGTDKDCADETVEVRRSTDGGLSWSAPVTPFSRIVDGQGGSLRVVYVTALGGGHLLACGMWIDRQTHPGMPLFNTETEGCLPMKIVLADSFDNGATWSGWRSVDMARDIGPPSLTNPVLRFASGRLAISIESNKQYLDRSVWRQKVVYLFSDDGGATWLPPRLVCRDPSARIFNWDQRAAVSPGGRVVSFSWTYDRQTQTYLNIHRRISINEGASWSAPEDLGFADQPSHPAVLPDGRVVLAWVDRFGSRSIRARLAESIDGAFGRESEVVLHEASTASNIISSTGEALADMQTWSYGLPFAEALPDGDVMVVYYAGLADAMDIRWVRLGL